LFEADGSAIERSWQDGLPSPSAFDHVRRAAFIKGHKSIVLLFDEAQLFFPKMRGFVIGDRLKDTLRDTGLLLGLTKIWQGLFSDSWDWMVWPKGQAPTCPPFFALSKSQR